MLLMASIGLSQERLLEFKLDDDAGSFLISKETFSLTNHLNDDLAFLIQEKKKAYALLLNAKAELKKTIVADKVLIPKYSEIVGYNYEQGEYILIGKHQKNKNKFAAISINFQQETVSTEEFVFEFDNQRFLASVQYNDRMLLITVDKQNNLRLWNYDNQRNFKKLASFKIPIKGKKQDLYSTIFKGRFLTKIDNRVPAGIEQTGRSAKLYPRGDHLYLTFDHRKDGATTLHEIDLANLTMITSQFNYPESDGKKFDEFNSYLLDKEHLVQIAANNEMLKFEIKDLKGTVKKTYIIDVDNPINIANSPIYQDKSMYSNKPRALKTNKQFLRKISKGSVGLTGYKLNEEYVLSIGGFKVTSSGGTAIMPGFGSSPVPVDGSSTVYFNPTFAGYHYSYSSTAVYFNTNLDSQFEHIDKTVEEKNVFAKVDAIANEVERITAEDVFFYKGQVHYIFFDQREKTYNLYNIK